MKRTASGHPSASRYVAAPRECVCPLCGKTCGSPAAFSNHERKCQRVPASRFTTDARLNEHLVMRHPDIQARIQRLHASLDSAATAVGAAALSSSSLSSRSVDGPMDSGRRAHSTSSGSLSARDALHLPSAQHDGDLVATYMDVNVAATKASASECGSGASDRVQDCAREPPPSPQASSHAQSLPPSYTRSVRPRLHQNLVSSSEHAAAVTLPNASTAAGTSAAARFTTSPLQPRPAGASALMAASTVDATSSAVCTRGPSHLPAAARCAVMPPPLLPMASRLHADGGEPSHMRQSSPAPAFSCMLQTPAHTATAHMESSVNARGATEAHVGSRSLPPPLSSAGIMFTSSPRQFVTPWFPPPPHAISGWRVASTDAYDTSMLFARSFAAQSYHMVPQPVAGSAMPPPPAGIAMAGSNVPFAAQQTSTPPITAAGSGRSLGCIVSARTPSPFHTHYLPASVFAASGTLDAAATAGSKLQYETAAPNYVAHTRVEATPYDCMPISSMGSSSTYAGGLGIVPSSSALPSLTLRMGGPSMAASSASSPVSAPFSSHHAAD